MKKREYIAISGWFDLSKLDLPARKFNAYADLQKMGQQYQDTLAHQKRYNARQLDELKELCALMQMDLIQNYDALERC